MDIRILVVEDDEHIGDMVVKFLQREGYSVDLCLDGAAALERFYEKNYHLVILDILLPGMNGQELLREIRKLGDTPVLMMTALGDEKNQLTAFANEADDYVVKPFSMQILIKRVEALLRRSGVMKKEIKAGNLSLFPETYEALFNGEKVNLTPKEFEILLLFAQNGNKIVPHETLLTKIWGYDFDGNEGIIHASIKKLRDKLPENVIRTVKGIGYSLEGGSDET